MDSIFYIYLDRIYQPSPSSFGVASRISGFFSFGRSPEDSDQTPPSEMRYALHWMSQLNEFHIQQDKYFTG